jgi:septum formation protein
LLGFSGKSVDFLTATVVICKASGFEQTHMDVTCVSFRALEENEIRRYVALDMPLDCAGSFRSEAAGPVLMKSLQTDDPTAIVGLPLIGLANMLRAAGFRLP